MKYLVTVTEKYEKTITIEATSAEEAIQKTTELWNNNDSSLNSPPFKSVSYSAVDAGEA